MFDFGSPIRLPNGDVVDIWIRRNYYVRLRGVVFVESRMVSQLEEANDGRPEKERGREGGSMILRAL